METVTVYGDGSSLWRRLGTMTKYFTQISFEHYAD